MIIILSGLIVLFGVVLPALIAILVVRKRKAAAIAEESKIDTPKRGEVPDVYFETFGHPKAPLQFIDELLAEKSLADLPAGYAWEFAVENDSYPGKGGDYIRLTTNIVNLLDDHPDNRIIGSHSIDLTWMQWRHQEKGVLWSTYYRNNNNYEPEYLMQRDLINPIIKWAEVQVDHIRHRTSVRPVRGYYFREGGGE